LAGEPKNLFFRGRGFAHLGDDGENQNRFGGYIPTRPPGQYSSPGYVSKYLIKVDIR
jgi:hypothetical protein